jgi:putative transposase
MAYIDLNMVRAGSVVHPSEWKECGYNEILDQPERYTIIDRKALTNILGFADEGAMIDAYQQAVSDAMRNEARDRQPMWTESVAVGDEDYVTGVKRKLSSMAIGRTIITSNSAHELREPLFPYDTCFNAKNNAPRLENTFLWNNIYDISNT